MTDKEIEEKAKNLASRIRKRIAMNQEDTDWVAFQIKWFGTEIKNKLDYEQKK